MILREFHLTNMLNCWFSKMDVCVPLDLLAAGNTVGEVEHSYTLINNSNNMCRCIYLRWVIWRSNFLSEYQRQKLRCNAKLDAARITCVLENYYWREIWNRPNFCINGAEAWLQKWQVISSTSSLLHFLYHIGRRWCEKCRLVDVAIF